MTLAFKRVYVDIPPDTHARLKALAEERGMSQRALVTQLIDDATSKISKPKRSRKRGKA